MIVEQYKGGVKYDRRAGAFDRAASFVRMQLAGDARHTDALLGRRGKSEDAEVYGRASRRRPSNALRNCLKNLAIGTELNTTEAPDEGASSVSSEGQYSLSETDSEYLAPAKDPEANRKQLQRMVDEAASAAGYNIKVYHGTIVLIE